MIIAQYCVDFLQILYTIFFLINNKITAKKIIYFTCKLFNSSSIEKFRKSLEKSDTDCHINNI